MAPIIKDKKIVLGGILVIVGILLFFRNADFFYFHLPYWLFSWEMILIGIGVLAFLTSDNPTAGIILMAIGGFFLLQDIVGPIFHFTFQFWPLILVIIGILIILRHRQKPFKMDRERSGNSGKTDVDIIDEIAVFGGGEKNITSKNFKGGKITAIFGGGDIDMTQAELQEGVSVLEVFALFGGWGLVVPAHWNVEIKITPLFGGFSDKRRFYETDVTDNTRTLIIKGVVLFGGGEIKNFKTK